MKHFRIFLFTAVAWLSIIFISSCTTTGAGTTTYYLVRHAEKAVDGTEDPNLAPEGQLRAQKLAEILGDKKISRLYSTDFKRTRQTLQPLADTFGLPVLIYNHRDMEAIDRMLAECKGHVAVIAGHSNSTPRLANRLIGNDVYADLDEKDYTKMWKIVVHAKRVKKQEVITY